MKYTPNLCILLSFLFAFYSNAQTPPSAPAALPTVNLGYATYQGVPSASLDPFSNISTRTTQFLGIRYGAPPTGSLRWREPRSPATTPGVQLASEQPNRCNSADGGMAPKTPFREVYSARTARRQVVLNEGEVRKRVAAEPDFSEDCLFLNLHVPGNIGDKKNLPVVFWIHGGGYISGSVSGFLGVPNLFNGNDLVREAGGNAIVVSIQYRLGVFGFLPGQKVKDGGSLNVGLLDQQFALKWVQQHISKFGGDPKKVTIWGESAGAGSVLQQVVANGGKTNPPLFRAAISGSSFLPSQYNFNDWIPEILYSETVLQTGCASAKDTLQCLRQTDVKTLEAANREISSSGFYGTSIFVPVVDGTLIRDRPTVLLKQKKVNSNVLYAVTNTFEGTIFVNQSTTATVTTSAYLSNLFPNFGAKEIAAGTAAYAGLGLSNIDQANAIIAESIFVCPTYFMLRAFGANAYKGEFAIPPGLHGDDGEYYFPHDELPAFANRDFVNAFAETFLNFAISGDPNVKWESNITPRFPKWVAGTNEMLFNKTDAGAPNIQTITTPRGLLKRCAFWDTVSSLTAQ